MKQIGIKMSDDVREVISSLFYIVPKKQKGQNINIFISDGIDVLISTIAERHQKYVGGRGAPRRSKSKVIEAILEAFAVAHRQGKFGDKELAKVLQESKQIVEELNEIGINLGVTKSVFVSALVRYLCRTQKLSDKLFENIYNY